MGVAGELVVAQCRQLFSFRRREEYTRRLSKESASTTPGSSRGRSSGLPAGARSSFGSRCRMGLACLEAAGCGAGAGGAAFYQKTQKFGGTTEARN